MTERDARQDDRATAIAVRDGRCEVERPEQFGGVVGLLVDRCRRPVFGSGAARVRAPVVAQDGVLADQISLGDLCPVSGIASSTRDEQQRRATTMQLVVEGGAVDR